MDPSRKKELTEKVNFNPSAYQKLVDALWDMEVQQMGWETGKERIPRRAFFKWFHMYNGRGIPKTPYLATAPPPVKMHREARLFQNLYDVWLDEAGGVGYYVGLKTIRFRTE